MAARSHKIQSSLGRSAVKTFAANGRVNQILIEHLEACRLERQTARESPHHRGDLYAHAQCAHQVDPAYCAASEGSNPAQPHALHAAAGSRSISGKRRRLRCNARGSARWRRESRGEVLARRMGATMAGWRGDALLHAGPRSPPSRTGVHACASARISVTKRGDGRALELGEALE